ncbi:hypothetical protein ACHAWF_012030 [Thalassiosira exigua]
MSGSGEQRQKRRRTSAPGVSLSNLPNEALSHVASYLPRPSRAFFAAAFCGRRGIRDRWIDGERCNAEVIEAITALNLGERWDVLDFGEIERSLASKITDKHIEEVLLCIDANANLKQLKLAGCVGVTGSGMNPLRGSAMLERIDLSLVREHTSPELHSEPNLSCEFALPVLESIVARSDNALRYIIFPKTWTGRPNTVLPEFMRRYSQMLDRRNILCCGCDNPVRDEPWNRPNRPAQRNEWIVLDSRRNVGVQDYTCHLCMKYTCYARPTSYPRHLNRGGDCVLKYCIICERGYCVVCASMTQCARCRMVYCRKCHPGGRLYNTSTTCGLCIGSSDEASSSVEEGTSDGSSEEESASHSVSDVSEQGQQHGCH